MLDNLKRLSLGLGLVIAAACVLLLSDLDRRVASKPKLPQVALFQHVSQAILDEGARGVIAALADKGFVDGQTVVLRRFNAEGDGATANTIAKDITDGRYDLVVSLSTLSLQAIANANRGGAAKHVFAMVSDPAGAGVGISRDDPLKHPKWMAGYGTMQPVEATLRLAKQLFPGLARLGVAWNPAESNSEAQVKIARKVCKELGIELLEANIDNSSAIAEAVGSLVSRGIEALWVDGDITMMTGIDTAISTTRKANIPVFTCMPGAAERGALFDLGANYFEVGRLAGDRAAEILRGVTPATMPIENRVPETLLFNRATLNRLEGGWHLTDEVARKAKFVDDNAVRVPTNAAAPAARPIPGRTYKIGLLYFAPEPGVEGCMQGLFDGLRNFGFIEGQNLEVVRTHAQSEIANIPHMLQNLDTLGLDLIVPLSTPCLTGACGSVKNTPVVFSYVYDPIAAGAGTSFTDHNPNVTGVGSFPPVEETVELIRRVVPGVTRVGTLYNAAEANSRKVVETARGAFAKRNIQLEEVTVSNAAEVYQAAQALVAREAQAFWISGDNTAIQGFDGIVKVANDARLPLINNDPEMVVHGALACDGIGFYEAGYAAAAPAAKVLTGTSPKDIPFENVAVRTLLVNLDQARVLGRELPADLVKDAETVIDSTGVKARTAQKRQPPSPQASPSPAPLTKRWKIDVLEYVTVLDVEEGEHGLRKGLDEAGLKPDIDYTMRVRSAQGDMPTISTLVDAAMSDGADMLVTFSTPTLQAALQKAGSLPIVFTFVADGVAAGAGKSLTDHRPNVTGVPTAAAIEEMFGLIQELMPGKRRFGSLFVPAEANSVHYKEHALRVAAAKGFDLVTVAANTSSEVSDAVLSLLAQRVDAIVQLPSNVTAAAFGSIAQPAQRANVPVFGFLSGDLPNGAGVVLARDYVDGGREAGLMAARIMRGANPAGIPFAPLKATRLLINLEVARASGLTIPQATLDHAAQVIGR